MNILWKPQEGPQTKFLKSNIFEVIFGGAAGGGKSEALMADGLRQIGHPDYKAIIFRKTFPQLSELIERSKKTFPKIGGVYNEQKKLWDFSNAGGGKYVFSHMEHEKDKYIHDGKEYQHISFDELTHFSETQYLYMMSRCRTSNSDLQCYVRASAMPMGQGISWVKQRFIDNGPFTIYTDELTGLKRQFIPSTLDDNKILMEADPQYENKLKLLGNKLYQALRHGDWDVIQGAAFEEIEKSVHMVKPHLPPKGALVWRSFDWGYSKPFSVGWYYLNCDKKIVRFHEWYGWNGQADTGLRMDSKDVAIGIKEYDDYLASQEIHLAYGVADPACWSKDDDAPSIADKMEMEGVFWQPAHNDRIQGKMEFHHRLRVDAGRTGLMVTADCKQWWRTIPMIQVDEKKPEDVDTKMEDHIYDETRYALMSQPCFEGESFVDFGSDRITSNQEW